MKMLRPLLASLLFAGCAAPPALERQAAAPPSSRAAVGGVAAVDARERGGLGTGFGEERESRTSATSFVRARSGSPDGVDRIYYNDRAGLEALLLRYGGTRRTAGLQRAAGGLVSWGVRSGGRWLAGAEVQGDRVIAGERGGRYSVIVRNETPRRLEAVVSVDGLDVMDGRRASVSKRGYILAPHATLTVDGFRTSSDTVAAFRFSSVAGSYASLRHGDTRDVGVIGLAVFTERESRRWSEPPPGWRRDGSSWDEREIERRRRAEPFR